ncbi:MAG: AmmeMemoRadiSam system radical SAM enzyme [Erysipelotrichaceae bacterium]
MIECKICFHACRLEEGQTGFCRARRNVHGEIVLINYGKVTSVALDPIEKKPLQRFYPGKKILSLGAYGCNLRCPFCQNYNISMSNEKLAVTSPLPPEEVLKLAQRFEPQGSIGVAYTYNEPLISLEYVLDCAKLIRHAGMKNVLVTNGTINEQPLRRLLPYIDAMNIDLKGFTQAFYDKLQGDLASVKRTIQIAAKSCHVEITTLIIPGENDSEELMEQEAKWIATINPEIPLHLTRFFPSYLWIDKPSTPLETLYRLERIAKQHLKHVYLGNI